MLHAPSPGEAALALGGVRILMFQYRQLGYDQGRTQETLARRYFAFIESFANRSTSFLLAPRVMLPAISCPTAPGTDSVLSSLLTQLIAPARAEVGQWLAQAGELCLTDATAQRGFFFLEQLLAVLTPKETVLLPNYPNPFNPETWIPYGLANDTDVRILIYDISGALVRQLDLGHQRAGHYTERSRAAYWDGRNGSGEFVASGVYFYTLNADTFRSTRKMLVGK